MTNPLRRDRPGLYALGKSPAEPPASQLVSHLESEVVAPARAAGREPRLLILTHKGPDPDALGACVGLAHALERRLGCPAEVATTGRIFRAENLAMVRELALYFEDLARLDAGRYDAALLVDSQPGFGHTFVPPGVPLLGVIDHHRGVEDRERMASVPHRDVREGVGSTSAIVYEYLRDLAIEPDQRTATALFCGVRYDTNDLSQNVSPLDEEAYFELFRRADRQKLARIQRPRLPQEYFKELQRSLRLAKRYGPAVVGLLGQVKNPESVAEMADFFLRLETVQWTLVGGAYEGQYYVSLRTRLGQGEAYPLLDRLLDGEGSFGGHGSVAGGRIEVGEGAELMIRRIERRLRAKTLEIIDPTRTLDEESRQGRSLTC